METCEVFFLPFCRRGVPGKLQRANERERIKYSGMFFVLEGGSCFNSSLGGDILQTFRINKFCTAGNEFRGLAS